MSGNDIKIKSKGHTSTIVWIVIGVILCIVAARILIWEHNYYSEKEGSARAASVSSITTDDEVDETDVTDQMKAEHVVAADRPRYLSIEKLGIVNARVLSVGTTSAGQLGTPLGIFDVGWYTESSKPGTGGAMLMDGHNGGPTKEGVFKHLPSLESGDIIKLERGDGKIFNYRVVENLTFSISDANTNMSMMFFSAEPGIEGLNLITCTGQWSQAQRTYLSRNFIRAVLTE
ncbi:MAG: class F sortase [Candidatus Saccharibacteria bacterium]|nr:class F sortase [Candidatus Saccharibacteria bacterium]